MATDDAGLADRLDRFLDELTERPDRSPNGRPAVAPELASAVRRLRDRDDAPTADQAFADRLLEDLMRATTYPGPFPFNPTSDLATTPASQTAPRPAFRPVRRLDASRPRWVLAQFATAALLLLTLGSVYVAFVSRHLSQGDAPIVVPAVSQDPVELVWQTGGGPDLPFDDPGQMAIDPHGNLWVPDGGKGRFQVFAPDGGFLETWGTPGSGAGQFDFVYGTGMGAAAFDGAGNLYVADTGNDRIQKFDPDRAFVTAWGGEGTGDGQFLAPVDVAVDGNGRVYVTDWDRDDVQVFDGDGRFLAAWGGYGPEPGYLIDPTGVTVDASGNVWIADAYNHRLQRFSPDGALRGGWGGYGADEGKLDNPVDLAVDGQGRIYVAEWGNHRVQVFDDDGRFLAAWGGLGTGDGQFIGLASIVVDGRGQVYVADNDRDRVQVFRLLPPLAP